MSPDACALLFELLMQGKPQAADAAEWTLDDDIVSLKTEADWLAFQRDVEQDWRL